MAFMHGVYAKELPTSILPPSRLADGIPVFIGTAPVQQKDIANANKAVLCFRAEDFIEQFGYSDNWEKYTLCEAYYACFVLYQIAPVVFINVLDINEHKTTIADVSVVYSSGQAILEDGVVPDTLMVKNEDGTTTYDKGKDYVLSYSDEGKLLLTALPGGSIPADTTQLSITADVLDPGEATKADIIGGIDLNSGKREGLMVIDEIFSRYNKIPGTLGAPGYAHDSEVGAVMTARMQSINGVFKGQMVWLDISTKKVKKYTDVPQGKKDVNFFDPLQTVCWPMTKLGEKVYHGSTIAICVKATVDHGHDGIPYESPSNKPAQMDSCVLADGSEVFLTNTEANYLNENGVVTFLNFIGGWKLWGNRTAAYPAVTDPKDSFICIRSMMSWWGNREVLTYWQKVDTPMNKRLLTTIISSMKLDINGLAAQGAILGGEIKLVEEENPVTDLIDGKIAFHTWMGFIAPAETIIFVNEFDPRFIQALVAELAAA